MADVINPLGSFPGREHRGVWIATVDNIDYPKSAGTNTSAHQEELRYLIDQIEAAGMNAIYFQMRPVGDALYQSSIEPWSMYLTGTQGLAPDPLWNPLQFAIDYAHPKNIEVHAWINPYRARMSPSTDGLDISHMAIQISECAHPYGTYLWMDPGCERVQDWTYNVAIDIVSRYDVDGLHMDDYFYPYPIVVNGSRLQFPDNRTYQEYVDAGGSLVRDDWRRENVNKLIRRLNDGIHAAKPWVVFSISPFGLHRPGHAEGMPSPPILGMDPYTDLFADAKLWLEEGWLDALVPQLYWRIAPAQQSYPILLDWWVRPQQNPNGHRHVYPGSFLTRIHAEPPYQNWPIHEIWNQIEITREPQNRIRGSWGNVQFSAKTIRDNVKNITQYFKNVIYPLPALQPTFPWLSNVTYARIERMRPSVQPHKEMGETLMIGCKDSYNRIVHKIAIYERVTDQGWTLVKIIDPETQGYQIAKKDLKRGEYAISFINRFGQESVRTPFTV